MSEKKRICLLIPSLQAGGMERVMSELLLFFSKNKDLELHLILYGKERGVFYKIPENTFLYKPEFVFNDKFRIFSTIKTLFFVRKSILKVNPTTILSFGEYWNSFVLLALFGLTYPVFISDRCKPDKKYGRIHSVLRRWLYPRSNGIIAQTKKAKEIYLQEFRHSNIEVIGNPIRQVSTSKDSQKKENIILTVGRLIKSKHHNLLIEVFSNLDAPDWKLVIVGGDSQKQRNSIKLKKLIHDLSLVGKVILTGESFDVDDYYQRSKIFAFTSSSEGFPNVIGEAMSAGLPVVSFDCIAGPSEMIEDGVNGYLVPLFDSEFLRTRLQHLINNEALRHQMGQKAKASIIRLQPDEIGKKYLSFILGE